MAKISTLLYYISLLPGCWNIVEICLAKISPFFPLQVYVTPVLELRRTDIPCMAIGQAQMCVILVLALETSGGNYVRGYSYAHDRERWRSFSGESCSRAAGASTDPDHSYYTLIARSESRWKKKDSQTFYLKSLVYILFRCNRYIQIHCPDHCLFTIVWNAVSWTIEKYWSPKKDPISVMGWVGLGGAMAQWCITPCSEVYSLAPTFARSSKALRSSRVTPANNPFHSCKYSTGTSRTIWYGHNCYCQFKERTSIPTIFDRFVLIYDKYNIYNIPQPPEQWSVHNLVTRQRSIQ